MVRLPLDASDIKILDVVHRWVELLAKGRDREAFYLTWHPKGDTWTLKLMRQVIAGYGMPEPHDSGEVFRITSRKKTRGGPKPRHEVTRPNPQAPPPKILAGGTVIGSYESLLNAEPGFIGEVWYDLPLNGKWSDLTATFDLAVHTGSLVLVLNGIYLH